MQNTPSHLIHIIYCGGTFGCHGEPLSPLAENIFLPLLENVITDISALNSNTYKLSSHNVKDSSQLNTADLANIYQYIFSLYEQGERRFLLIHGTDTLSYTAAFLANAFANTDDISIHITGSMHPLLHADAISISLDAVNTGSDALSNLTFALANIHRTGVWVNFANQLLPAINTQKTHSQQDDAFSGAKPLSALKPLSSQLEIEELTKHIQKTRIVSYFCIPSSIEQVESDIEHLLNQKPDALILIGYGVGNVPTSTKLAELITHATQNGTLIITTTQVPFGGVTGDYAAGSWLADAGALSGEHLTIPAVYARLLWLSANISERAKRATFW